MSEIVIVNRWNGAVIVKGEAESIKALLTTLWRDANLQDANLQDANLQDANLRDANLQGAHLQGANLQGANLQDANLQGAHLQGANLRDANLQDANLQGAHLQDANLRDANLRDANLQGAHLQGANLQGANLDYSAWPLQCSSTKAILDDRLKAQLLYHALCLVGDSVVIPEEMKTFVNSNFHRIGECPKL